jgi:hypothetical protein
MIDTNDIFLTIDIDNVFCKIGTKNKNFYWHWKCILCDWYRQYMYILDNRHLQYFLIGTKYSRTRL